MEKTTEYRHWNLKKDEEGILWLGFNQAEASVNSLNESTLGELAEIIDALPNQPSPKAIILYSEKQTGFIVGADISQFKTFTSPEEAIKFIKKGQEIFNQLEKVNIPTIALIEGFCLGGGLELALACKYRIAENSPKTRLGLPEVKLGILPGWGGTMRLPQLVGPIHAMDVILTGKSITANQAKKIKLIDESVPKRLLNKVAIEYAINPPKKKKKALWLKAMKYKMIRSLLGKVFLSKLKKKVNEKHYPAPFCVIENWIAYGGVPTEALHQEAESVSKLLVSDTSRNLVRVFFLQENLKHLSKLMGFTPTHVHVVGAGVMGGDIAAWCALQGFKVTLQDQAPKLIGNAVKCTYQLAKKQLKENYLINEVMDRLIPDPLGLGIQDADVIIEAITEKKEAKQALFAALESQAKEGAILATNTSTIPLEEISTSLKNPKRLVGIHFFNPVAKMPLVEVVRGKETDENSYKQAMFFVRKINKLPLPVKSMPGFLVNRILLPYMLEAMVLLEEGVSSVTIDEAAKNFGMPMGPIELADSVGLDICLAALEKLGEYQNEKIPEKLKDLVNKGELGKKTGKGFYQYKSGKVIKPKLSNKETIPADITYRLILRLLNEAIACLKDGIVENEDLLDAGCIFGFGFPPFRGGPISYIRYQGEEKLLKLLEELRMHYGDRFAANEGWQTQNEALEK